MKALHLLGGQHNAVIGQVFRMNSRHHVRMLKTNTFVTAVLNCWFSHDVTKFQTSELLILLRFYFHDA